MSEEADLSPIDKVGRHESEIYLRLALDAGQMAAWSLDVATGRIEGSPELRRLLGLPADRTLDFSLVETGLFPGERKRLKTIGAMALARGEQLMTADFPCRWPDGSVHWLRLRAEITSDENGRAQRYLGVLFDVSGQHVVELETARGKAIGNALLEASLDCIITIDENSRIIEWNSAAERTFGYVRSAVLGRDLAELIIPERLRAAHRAGVRRYLSGGGSAMIGRRKEVEALRADGSVFDAELAINPVQIGSRRYFTAFLRDITARKEREADRRLSMRELSHRMKNTLALVRSIASQTLRQYHDVEVAERMLEARLIALARAQEGLFSSNRGSSSIREVVDRALKPYMTDARLFAIDGAEMQVDARQALGLSLALHELATNAMKYGALSCPVGRVQLVWGFDGPDRGFRLEWKESDGPPVKAPERRGFGSRMIEQALGGYFDGTASIAYEPDGVRFVLLAPATAFESAA